MAQTTQDWAPDALCPISTLLFVLLIGQAAPLATFAILVMVEFGKEIGSEIDWFVLMNAVAHWTIMPDGSFWYPFVDFDEPKKGEVCSAASPCRICQLTPSDAMTMPVPAGTRNVEFPPPRVNAPEGVESVSGYEE